MSKLVDSQNTDIKSCRARAGLDVTPLPLTASASPVLLWKPLALLQAL